MDSTEAMLHRALPVISGVLLLALGAGCAAPTPEEGTKSSSSRATKGKNFPTTAPVDADGQQRIPGMSTRNPLDGKMPTTAPDPNIEGRETTAPAPAQTPPEPQTTPTGPEPAEDPVAPAEQPTPENPADEPNMAGGPEAPPDVAGDDDDGGFGGGGGGDEGGGGGDEGGGE